MAASKQQTLSMYVSTADVTLTGLNPRKDFNEEAMGQLSRSIQAHGIIEPLVVRRGKRKGIYDLVAGERRLKAAQALGLTEVPVVVRDYSDDQVREVMLLENLQRQDLKPIEEATALSALVEMGMSVEDVADRIGMSQSWVYGRMRLLKLPSEILKYLEEGKLGVEHAMAFVPYVDWPVIDALVKDLKEAFDNTYRGKVTDMSKHEVRHMIDLQLRNGKQTMDIDSFGWYDNATKKKSLFHKQEPSCKDCTATIVHGPIKRLCLNPKCFRKKMRAVNKELKAKRKEEVDKLAEKGKVDLTRMGYGSYNELTKEGYNGVKFDLKECDGCESRKVGVDSWKKEHTVCTDPGCYRRKNEAVWKKQKQHANEVIARIKYNTERLTESKLEEVMADVQDRLLEYFLADKFEPRWRWCAEAVSPWLKKAPKKGWKAGLKKIPAKDVPLALLRLVALDMAQDIDNNASLADKNDLVGLFPELFEELPPKEEELDEAEVTPECDHVVHKLQEKKLQEKLDEEAP